MILWTVVALALAAGLFAGARLAARGITADNALLGRQRQAYAVLLLVAAAGAALYWGPKLRWMPTPLVLYGEAVIWDAARALAAFALGLLLGVEWRGRRERRRLMNLAGGGTILAVALGFLIYRSLPVTGLLLPSVVEDGVVMQTTSYTCAPASIATLARLTGRDTAMTERDAVRLTGTTREGTSARAELRALRALGFTPRYRRYLTPESLAVLGPAVLHVNEPVLATKIGRAHV